MLVMECQPVDIPMTTDSKGITRLPFREVVAILRGVDDLEGRGGRALLVELLKGGSRNTRLRDLGLENSPVYGYCSKAREADIYARVDWVIEQGYRTIEHDGRQSQLVYTTRGWEVEKKTMASELLRGFDEMLASGITLFNMNYLRGRKRELVWLLLDKVLASGDPKYIPILAAWKKIEYKNVGGRIRGVISELQKAG